MLRHKKLIFGLCLLLGIASSGWLLAQKVFAAECKFAACSKSDITNSSNYRFIEEGIIFAEFRGKTVTFKDDNPGDTTHQYLAQNDAFCSGGGGKGSIKISGEEWKKVGFGEIIVYAETVDIDWFNAKKLPNGECIDLTKTNEDMTAVPITNFNKVADDSYIWDSQDIISVGKGVRLTDWGNGQLYLSTEKIAGCPEVVISLSSKGGNSGNEYLLLPTDLPGGTDAANNKEMFGAFAKGECDIMKGPRFVQIGGTKGEPAPEGAGLETGTTEGDTCESNFNSGFEWVFCPALKLAGGTANLLNDFVEGQLCVNTGASSTEGGTTCGGANIYGENTNKPSGVKQAWATFKNIATALLVILMLVMVISQ